MLEYIRDDILPDDLQYRVVFFRVTSYYYLSLCIEFKYEGRTGYETINLYKDEELGIFVHESYPEVNYKEFELLLGDKGIDTEICDVLFVDQ